MALRQQIGITVASGPPGPPVPPTPIPWDPTQKGALQAYFGAFNVVLDSNPSLVDTIKDNSTNAFDCNCLLNGDGGSILAGKPTLITNWRNGQPALSMDYRTGGGFNVTTYNPLVCPPMVAANQPFGFAWVGAFGPVGNQYTSVIRLAGPNVQESLTLYFTSRADFTTDLFLQFGTNPNCFVIGNVGAFDFTQPHQATLSYQGNSDPQNPASYSFVVNGNPVSLFKFTFAGGVAPNQNWLGNRGNTPIDVNLGILAEFLVSQAAWTAFEQKKWNSYCSKYALVP